MSFAGRKGPGDHAKQFAPYVIALGAVAWVLRSVDWHQLWAKLSHAPIGLFVAVSAVMLVANCAADTFAMQRTFAWFGCRVAYRDLFVVRAATYLVAVVNYHVGQAAILGYLYKARQVPFWRAGGWILFIILINVGTLFLLASAGASNAQGSLAWLRMVPIITVAAVVVYAVILRTRPSLLARRGPLAPLFEMNILGHVKGVLVRLPHVGVLMVWHFCSLRLFGIAVPPLDALLYLPAYFAVSSLPINVNGLGVAQLVAIAFFAKFVPVPADVVDPAQAHKLQEAAVLAYSIATSVVSILLQLVLGLAFLRPATRLGLSPSGPPPSSEQEQPPAAEAELEQAAG